MSTNSGQDVANAAPAPPAANRRLRRVTAAQFRLALQLALIAVAGYFAGTRFTYLFSGETGNFGGLWCATIGSAVLNATREATWKEGSRQVLGALIGAEHDKTRCMVGH